MSDRENQPDYDQDSDPTMKAPDEGRPDGTVAPERDGAGEGSPRDVAEDEQDEPGEHIGPPE